MNPRPPTRRTKDYLLPFLIIIAIGVIAVLLVRLWSIWSADEDISIGIAGSAELSNLEGGVEVYLPVSEAWKITTDAVTLSAGERVRTDANGSATLTFDEGSELVLGASSELGIEKLQNAINNKHVELVIAKGDIGITAGTMNGSFSIENELIKISNADGTYLVSMDEKETFVTAISGGFTATILDSQNEKYPELENFVVEPGQTIEITERRVNNIRKNITLDLVKATPESITTSSMYLALRGEEAPAATGAAEETESDSNEGTLDPDLITTDAERDTLPAPLIITGNGNITAVTDPVSVSGKVAPKVSKVEISYENEDPFLLSKFEAGSGEWSYNAAVKFGNLEIGVNNYTVIGYDEAGNPTPSANFQIRYNPDGVEEIAEEETITPSIETTDGVPEAGSTTFAAPVVTQPADGTTFTESPIAFSGTVPVGTKEVIINEYKLTSFSLGDTTWKYNADPSYENLEVGENEYDIEAVSETGDRSKVTIKITYSPEDSDQ